MYRPKNTRNIGIQVGAGFNEELWTIGQPNYVPKVWEFNTIQYNTFLLTHTLDRVEVGIRKYTCFEKSNIALEENLNLLTGGLLACEKIK
jgi:hypothetical protein